jgi:hypothetical protein
MNIIKRIAGFLWMALAPAALWFLVSTALEEVARKPVTDTKVQWSVFCIVFVPISVGLFLFGWYALKGEYDHLPKSSGELDVD